MSKKLTFQEIILTCNSTGIRVAALMQAYDNEKVRESRVLTPSFFVPLVLSHGMRHGVEPSRRPADGRWKPKTAFINTTIPSGYETFSIKHPRVFTLDWLEN